MNMGLELDVVDLVFVVINFVMMFLIFLCFFLLLRFLWRAGRKQSKAGAGENTAYNKEEIGEDDMTASSTAAAAGVSLGAAAAQAGLRYDPGICGGAAGGQPAVRIQVGAGACPAQHRQYPGPGGAFRGGRPGFAA